MRKFILVFFDDILVYSENLSDHVQHLHIVLTILRQNQLTARMSKCCFAMTEMGYLGHIISGSGVATYPKKITVVLNWPVPAIPTKLRGFLGSSGYYRRFVKEYGEERLLCMGRGTNNSF